MSQRTVKVVRDQKAEAEAEMLSKLDRVIALGEGSVVAEVRAEGETVFIYVYYFLRKRINQEEAQDEIRAALMSILGRKPFGGVNLEVLGDEMYLSFFIRKMYRTPALDRVSGIQTELKEGPATASLR